MAEYDRAMQIDSTNMAQRRCRWPTTTAAAITGRYSTSPSGSSTRTRCRSTPRSSASSSSPPTCGSTANLIQLDALTASTLAVRYPQDRRVVELYAKHLIASGELEQALALYKLHLDDQPPRRKLLPVGDRHRELSPASRLGGPLHQRVLKLRRDRLPALERPRAELHQRVRQSDKNLSAVAPLRPHRFVRGAIWGLIGDTWHQKAAAGESGDEEDFVLISRKGSLSVRP